MYRTLVRSEGSPISKPQRGRRRRPFHWCSEHHLHSHPCHYRHTVPRRRGSRPRHPPPATAAACDGLGQLAAVRVAKASEAAHKGSLQSKQWDRGKRVHKAVSAI
jgi:hypothetical protein